MHEFPDQFLGDQPSAAPQHQVNPAVPKAVFMLVKQLGDLGFELAIFVGGGQLGSMIIVGGFRQLCRIQQVGQIVIRCQGGDRLDL